VRWTYGAAGRPPLWRAYYSDLADSRELSFAELTELRVVKAMRRAGLSLQSIRFAIELARDRFGLEKPLSTRSFKVDGKEILLVVQEEGGLVSLSSRHAGQSVFREIVQQSLSDLEFDGERPLRWAPRGARGIVIDPRRLFGQPILGDYGVSTRTLRDDYDTFGDLQYLSSIYEIPREKVRAAINFERSLDGQGSV
jgi:uncharacterized protein (DUF433 family)